MTHATRCCQYQDPDGFVCESEANASGFCYWHDKSSDKTGEKVKDALEAHVRKGGLLRGICLKNANLAGVYLVNRGQKEGHDMSYADLYHANLTGAHLFNINLSKASLMKADLRGANLNCANLEDTNLLGAKWSKAKIENIQFGKRLIQDTKARACLKTRNISEAVDYFEQAEEIYRDLRKHAEREGIFTLAGDFIHRELTMRRLQLPPRSPKRIASKMVDLFCGYGEDPWRIIILSIILIIICAFLYALTGLNYQGEMYAFSLDQTLSQNLHIFASCLYYSVVTFTTLGYGDFAPIGLSRALAAFEAFTGSFTIALFVVVFVKKMTR